jgi:hypothetical protein
MKETDEELVNRFGQHKWSNEDLDPVKWVRIGLFLSSVLFTNFFPGQSDETGREFRPLCNDSSQF